MMNKRKVRYYILENGKSPFLTWLEKIKDYTLRSRIERRLERLEFGNYGDYKFVGEGVFELRLDFGKGYRIYFSEEDDVLIILLCAGDKSTQTQDIKLAKAYWKKLKE